MDASHNVLTYLPDLSALRELRELHLHHNRLQELPAECWESLYQLSVLTLHQNELRAVPASFGRLPAHLQLSLDGNPLDVSG